MTHTLTASFRGAKRRGNLLSDNTLLTLSFAGFEEIATSLTALAMTEYSITLAMTHTHKHTQQCHSERSEESLGEYRRSIAVLSHRSFAALRMTKYSE